MAGFWPACGCCMVVRRLAGVWMVSCRLFLTCDWWLACARLAAGCCVTGLYLSCGRFLVAGRRVAGRFVIVDWLVAGWRFPVVFLVDCWSSPGGWMASARSLADSSLVAGMRLPVGQLRSR